MPDLLFLTIFAHAFIRVVLAGMFTYDAWANVSKSGGAVRTLAIIQIAVAAALFVGAWTQAAAIAASVLLLISLTFPQFRVWPRSTIALMLVMALSLIVTGPGAFAFDYPL